MPESPILQLVSHDGLSGPLWVTWGGHADPNRPPAFPCVSVFHLPSNQSVQTRIVAAFALKKMRFMQLSFSSTYRWPEVPPRGFVLAGR